jgi:lysozyme
MKISAAGLAEIKKHEGLRLNAYLPTPDDVWTIGYGSTKGVKEGDVITEDEAHFKLLRDIAWAEDCVNAVVQVALKQSQFDALVSLVLNIGAGAFRSSTLLRLLNEGDYEGASGQFVRWSRQKGRILAGLAARRAIERDMFNA